MYAHIWRRSVLPDGRLRFAAGLSRACSIVQAFYVRFGKFHRRYVADTHRVLREKTQIPFGSEAELVSRQGCATLGVHLRYDVWTRTVGLTSCLAQDQDSGVRCLDEDSGTMSGLYGWG